MEFESIELTSGTHSWRVDGAGYVGFYMCLCGERIPVPKMTAYEICCNHCRIPVVSMGHNQFFPFKKRTHNYG